MLLTMEDVAYVPGQATLFVGQLERDAPFGIRDSLEGEQITFSWNGREIGQALTDDEGWARIIHSVDGSSIPEQAEARASIDFRKMLVVRPVHRWTANRVIIAVDIDHTICDTEYDAVLLDDLDTESMPLPGAVDSLHALEQQFHLLYVTARPSMLLEQSRHWLGSNGLPAAPLMMAPSVASVADQAETKQKMLTDRRAHLPNLLIGIGDKESDAQSYSAAGMLSIILTPEESLDDIPNVVVVEDWSAIVDFFDANAGLLERPDRLSALLSRGQISELVIPQAR